MEGIGVDLRTGTESIVVEIAQSERLHSDVDFDVRTGTGGISLEVYAEGNVDARIVSSTGVGSIDIERSIGFEMTTSSLPESENYPASADFKLVLETGVGGIEIDAEYQP